MDPAPRLPLGEAWAGVCTRGGEPEETQQRHVCNMGYARGRCANFPADAKADAVRFSARQEEGRLVLIWVLEKAHAPVAHGICGDAKLESPMDRQAEVFQVGQAFSPAT
jgi:hypothetical protein